MREQLRQDLRAGGSAGTGHPGLFLERYALVDFVTGELSPEAKEKLLEEAIRVTVPPVYNKAFQRWRTAAQGNCWTVEVEVASRLLVGLGNHSPLEIGFSLHHTYGVPYIPGSALKGILNHWMADQLGGQDGEEGWSGVTYDPGPIGAPGSWHGTMFGSPEIDAATRGNRGAVAFEDALYIPGSALLGGQDRPLAQDVVTPHQHQYYSRQGEHSPNDWSSPQPHGFVSIRSPARFLLALSGPADWASLAVRHLLDALGRRGRGVGAKTAAGYGRLVPKGEIRVPDLASDEEKTMWSNACQALAAAEQAERDAERERELKAQEEVATVARLKKEAAVAAARAVYDGEQGKAFKELLENKVWNAASINDRLKAFLRLIPPALEGDDGRDLVTIAVERLFELHGQWLRRPPSGLAGQLKQLDDEWIQPVRGRAG